MKLKKVLVANRGEIAVRIIRALKELDIKSVAVYSDADRNALHTQLADEIYNIGEAPSASSYLRQDKIIETAQKAKADGIHPGYGFLAENGEFAELVEKSGITFIGPKADAIRLMGDKTAAREEMRKANVPVVPGTESILSSPDEAKETAAKIGYPVLVKARAGGGGKGMRVINEEKDLVEGIERASSEAKSAFGNGDVYMEKYLEEPRHIEIQVLADNYGNTIYLGERECSIQRRHQKVIEEAPSPIVTPEIRKQMGTAAVNAAKACGYRNAGTVEFLMDKNRNFYFLEMNTRLQVEHPVTEMVTGIDIVKEQLKIASGEKLEISQDDVKISGSAIESRIYAEDPVNNFLPSTGRIYRLREPQGNGIRVDSGVEAGGEISVYYDPLIAKMVVWSQSRDESVKKTLRALSEYKISGLRTNIAFIEFVMKNQRFIEGNFTTGFIAEEFSPEKICTLKPGDEKVIAIACALMEHNKSESAASVSSSGKGNGGSISNWKKKGLELNLR